MSEAPRPEDFGAVKGVRPEDFGASKLSRRKEDKAPPATGQRLLGAGLRGSFIGGLPGAFLGTSFEAGRVSDEALAKGAYDIGGKATDVAAKVLPPEAAAGIGFAANVGTQSIAALLGSKVGGVALSPAMESGAKSLMQSSLKPVLAELRKGRVAQEVQTLLDEGIAVTSGGLAKLRGKIDALNTEIARKISASTEIVDKQLAWKSVKETLDKFTKQVNPNSDIAKIKAGWNEFLEHPLITGDKIPVQLAQELKQGTYRVLAGKYGEVGSAETEVQKALARNLKEQVADAVPNIGKLNAQESKLLAALDPVERRVFVEANKNPGGLAWLTHNPASWASFVADKSSAFKSLLALTLYKSSKRLPEATAGGAMAVTQRERTE